jgi:hypothetical protein
MYHSRGGKERGRCGLGWRDRAQWVSLLQSPEPQAVPEDPAQYNAPKSSGRCLIGVDVLLSTSVDRLASQDIDRTRSHAAYVSSKEPYAWLRGE